MEGQWPQSFRITARRNSAHRLWVKISTGPPGCLESRTATHPEGSRAVSTQLPLGLLWLLFRHSPTRNRDLRTPPHARSNRASLSA
jgi:hypothetical protein